MAIMDRLSDQWSEGSPGERESSHATLHSDGGSGRPAWTSIRARTSKLDDYVIVVICMYGGRGRGRERGRGKGKEGRERGREEGEGEGGGKGEGGKKGEGKGKGRGKGGEGRGWGKGKGENNIQTGDMHAASTSITYSRAAECWQWLWSRRSLQTASHK